MTYLNESIEFYEMTAADPQILVWLLELRRHREDNWKHRAEAAEAKLAELEKQGAIGMVTGKLGAGLRVSCYYMPDSINLGDELFTRPAPAADKPICLEAEICSFVTQHYATYQGAHLCGKSAELVCYLLWMAGLPAKKSHAVYMG